MLRHAHTLFMAHQEFMLLIFGDQPVKPSESFHQFKTMKKPQENKHKKQSSNRQKLNLTLNKPTNNKKSATKTLVTTSSS